MENVLIKKRLVLMSTVAGIALASSGGAARAFEYQTDSGVVIRFDNTPQYSVEERVAPANSYLLYAGAATPAQPSKVNNNDGDSNMRSGIVENRFDLISRFDISYQGFGFDVSTASYYDFAYTGDTGQNAGNKSNNSNKPSNKFPAATVSAAGKNIELRNLFVYGAGSIGSVPITVRVGRQVNLYGESLLFAANGISYGQAPLDIARASSVPNTQAKDLFLPVGTATIQAQLSDAWSVDAYYQFEWEPFNFKPVGSYFSTVDLVGAGAYSLIAGVPGAYHGPGAPPAGLNNVFLKGRDIRGHSNGQFGAAVHYDPIGTQWDFGLYALQYNDSEPQVYTESGIPVVTAAGHVLGHYQQVYADGIQIYGVSTSTTVGPLNLAGEVSLRTHEDLASSVTIPVGGQATNGANSRYAAGNVLHYQASEIYLGPKTSFWDASAVTGEIAGMNLLGYTANGQNFNHTYRHMALGIRVIPSITYYDVYAGLDLTPTIGLGWNFMGLAPDTNGFNNTGIDRGGDITFSVKAAYQNNWFGSIGYTRYISPPGRDALADRDFASFNIERTF